MISEPPDCRDRGVIAMIESNGVGRASLRQEIFAFQCSADFLERRRDFTFRKPNLRHAFDIRKFLAAFFQKDYRAAEAEVSLEQADFVNYIFLVRNASTSRCSSSPVITISANALAWSILGSRSAVDIPAVASPVELFVVQMQADQLESLSPLAT